MKKKLFLTLLGTALFISLSACSDKSKSDSSSSKSTETTEQVSSTSLSTSSEATTVTSEETYDSNDREVFLESVVGGAKSQSDAMLLSDDNPFKDIIVESKNGNTLVMKYIFKEAVPEGTKEALESAGKQSLIDTTRSQFEYGFTIMPDFQVEISYLNPDNSVIYELTLSEADYAK